MDLRQLRYFVVLAEELHFRRAAERLNITQAPLSVAIQTLERELGGQLFHRTQRRVALTEVGAAFREHALSILDKVDRSISDVRDMVTGEAGQLRIGFTAAASLLSFFPNLICTFRNNFPNVAVQLRELSSTGQIAALQAREIDLGVVRKPSSQLPLDLAFTKLVRDRLVVAMHRDHPLSKKSEIDISDLRDERFIFYPRKSGVGIYDQFMELCRKRGFTPTIVQEVQDAATIVGLAATGLGIAVLPSELQCIMVPDIQFRPLADADAVTELLLVYRAGEHSACLDRFRQLTRTALASWKRDNPSFT